MKWAQIEYKTAIRINSLSFKLFQKFSDHIKLPASSYGILSSTASVATVATTSSIHDHVTKDPEDNVGAIAANPAIE